MLMAEVFRESADLLLLETGSWLGGGEDQSSPRHSTATISVSACMPQGANGAIIQSFG